MGGGWYLTVGIILGGLVALVYVLNAAGSPGNKLDLAKTVGVFIATNGVVATIRLVVLALTANSLGPPTDNDRLYLMVGAIAALWLSLQTIGKAFLEVSPNNTSIGKVEETENHASE